MAKLFNQDTDIKLSNYHLKHIALRYVHQWANLNSANTDEDFYNDTHKHDFYKHEGSDLIDFTEDEKEIMRKEFQDIDEWLQKRRDKYELKMDELNKKTKHYEQLERRYYKRRNKSN